MKANELRIGNLVKINNELLPETENEIYKVYGVNAKFDLSFPDSSGVVSLNHTKSIRIYSQFDEFINPIPLTEEWLLKFGFEKLTDKKNGFNSNSYTYTKGISFIVHLNDKLLSVNFWQGNEKKYVHELQNLFFVLTGEELTIQTQSKLLKMFGKQK